MSAPYERQEMMFAHRVKLDVFDKNDLAGIGLEDRAVNHIDEALAITIRQKLEGTRCASRCPKQSLPVWIFTNSLKQFQKRLLHARSLGSAATWNIANAALSCFQLG